jgi:hypothetical protein
VNPRIRINREPTPEPDELKGFGMYMYTYMRLGATESELDQRMKRTVTLEEGDLAV